jgi:preprotein translocase subunit SecD
MTRENINQNIAIALDDSVIFAPVLKAEITTGDCSITGTFTRSEAGFIAAVANHGVLPVDFVILK